MGNTELIDALVAGGKAAMTGKPDAQALVQVLCASVCVSLSLSVRACVRACVRAYACVDGWAGG